VWVRTAVTMMRMISSDNSIVWLSLSKRRLELRHENCLNFRFWLKLRFPSLHSSHELRLFVLKMQDPGISVFVIESVEEVCFGWTVLFFISTLRIAICKEAPLRVSWRIQQALSSLSVFYLWRRSNTFLALLTSYDQLWLRVSSQRRSGNCPEFFTNPSFPTYILRFLILLSFDKPRGGI